MKILACRSVGWPSWTLSEHSGAPICVRSGRCAHMKYNWLKDQMIMLVREHKIDRQLPSPHGSEARSTDDPQSTPWTAGGGQRLAGLDPGDANRSRVLQMKGS